MIQLEEIKKLAPFKNVKNKIELVYKGWEEQNRAEALAYYAVVINGVDKTQELFSANTIRGFVNEKIEIEHPAKNFMFIPSVDSFLMNTLDFTKISLKVYFRENGTTFFDVLVGSFFYADKHLLIHKRSLVLTDLGTLKKQNIKFENNVDIEWAVLINPTQIQIIQAFSNVYFIYDLEEQKFIDKGNIAAESIYPSIFRWIYRGQEYNSNQFQMELIQKKEDHFLSTYFKIN
jgi:hypothetical protein